MDAASSSSRSQSQYRQIESLFVFSFLRLLMCRKSVHRSSSVSGLSGGGHNAHSLRRGATTYTQSREAGMYSREGGPTSFVPYQRIEDNRDVEALVRSKDLGDSVNRRLYQYSKQNGLRGWRCINDSSGITLYFNTLTREITSMVPEGFMIKSTALITPKVQNLQEYALAVNAMFDRVRRNQMVMRHPSFSIHSSESSSKKDRASSTLTVPYLIRQNSCLSRGSDVSYGTEHSSDSSILMQLRNILFEGNDVETE